MSRVKIILICVVLSGCSSVGPGFANHPIDCAVGVEWADCLPGTAGYENGGGQLYKEQEAQAARQKTNDRLHQMANEFDACLQKHKTHIFKTYSETSSCINAAVEHGLAATNYPGMDLILSLDAKRTQLAAAADKKMISEEEMQAGIADKFSEIKSEEIQRNAQIASANAQEKQAIAAQQAALAQTISAIPQSQSTHCTTNVIGSQLNTNCY